MAKSPFYVASRALRPTSGSIHLTGRDTTHTPPNQRPVNAGFQAYALFSHLSVAQNIGFDLKLKGKPAAEVNKAVERVLSLGTSEAFATPAFGQPAAARRLRPRIYPEPEVLPLDKPLSAHRSRLRSLRIPLASAARVNNPDVVYGYPKEGYSLFMDWVALLSDAKNVDEAQQFINLVLDPKNAAIISSFERYANGVAGSAEFMPEDMKTAPKIATPAEFAGAGRLRRPRNTPPAHASLKPSRTLTVLMPTASTA